MSNEQQPAQDLRERAYKIASTYHHRLNDPMIECMANWIVEIAQEYAAECTAELVEKYKAMEALADEERTAREKIESRIAELEEELHDYREFNKPMEWYPAKIKELNDHYQQIIAGLKEQLKYFGKG